MRHERGPTNKRRWPLICKYCAEPFLGWRATQEYCCHACHGLASRLTEADFWALVDTSPHPQGCWLWTGRAYDNGTGIVYGRFASTFAHRYAYQCYHQEKHLTADDFICHTCDTGLCVQDDHLFKGTAYDNTHDAMAKGRLSQGSRHTGATTTEDVVRQIWADVQTGAITMVAIARKYEVTYSVVVDIRQGNSWKHVTQAS